MNLVAAVLLAWAAPTTVQYAVPAPERASSTEATGRRLAGGADDPNLYAAAIDTDVTYDDSVAQTYDDGYGPRAYAQFEAALSPYGTWLDDAALGHVWVPSTEIVGANFSPYATKGTWVLTEYGWTWESGWAWGWAPFHYGRWTMLKSNKWAWVAGTLWGPAWVAWRAGRDYVGWAPLPPRGVHLGRPLGTRSPWRFIPAGSLGHVTLDYVPLRKVPSIFGHTLALSNVKSLELGTIGVRVNVGPMKRRCCGDEQPSPAPLATAAPNALPRLEIRPRTGAPLQSRPWVAAGSREQTPVSRWPTANGS